MSFVRFCAYRENRNRPHLCRCRLVPCHLGIYPAKSAYRYFDWCVEKMTPLFRKAVWLLFAVSVCAFAGSLAAQYVLGMEPCVLCISQRLCVLATALCAAVVLACKPKGRVGGLSGAVFISIPAVTGISVAAYQLWLQSLPPGAAPSCGAPWTFRLKGWPLFDWFEPVVRGFGNCAEPDYLLGVALPVWSAAYFLAVVLTVWWAWARAK
ncbi:disulfide bond formation protein DsbB [Neisseria gonorrhoeae DGI2]|nr:disulfide bond formation protein DsbB [Neisseria gonorrhoeae DGI2]